MEIMRKFRQRHKSRGHMPPVSRPVPSNGCAANMVAVMHSAYAINTTSFSYFKQLNIYINYYTNMYVCNK